MCDSFATRAFFLKYDSSVSNIYKAVIYHAYQTVCFAVTPFIYSSFYTPRALQVCAHSSSLLFNWLRCVSETAITVSCQKKWQVYICLMSPALSCVIPAAVSFLYLSLTVFFFAFFGYTLHYCTTASNKRHRRLIKLEGQQSGFHSDSVWTVQSAYCMDHTSFFWCV